MARLPVAERSVRIRNSFLCINAPSRFTISVLAPMELRHLRYLVGVAEALSFTKAADKLHTAQPSLSRQIKDLEEELGVRLLNRTKQLVTLTEEGRSFLADAKRLLALAAETVESVRQFVIYGADAKVRGTISGLAEQTLPETVPRVRTC